MQRPQLVALPSKERAIIHNLPAQLTPLIGREQEVAAACTLLRRPKVRLLTFTGTGGVGKTRLALQVATDLLDEFADGITFISLAPISDPDLVIPTIVQALDLKESGARPLLDLLKGYLKDKYVLLLLDNFEQVLPAAPHLTDLLASCPDLKLLVTSRAVLHVQGEHEFPVPPLALPDLKQLPEHTSLSHYAAVMLFIQRAQAARPDFQLTAATARSIAEICVRLDGLPLAIELSAARIKLFPPQALLKRLEHRFQVLTGGAQDAPVRQQTLRNTIQWSYDLLKPEEQRLFRRLSVFVGGCTLEALEALCSSLDDRDTAVGVLDGVTSLLDKSLLQQTEQEGEEPHLILLETLRDYGLEALVTYEELETTQQAHATYYLALVEEAERELRGSQGHLWLQRLERAYDNLRTAMQFSLGRREAGHSMQMALRFGGALRWFWGSCGHWSEARAFLERALAGNDADTTAIRAEALYTLGWMVAFQGDTDQACTLAEESLALCRKLGDTRGIALALRLLGGMVSDMGDAVQGRALFEESLRLFRELGEKREIAQALVLLSTTLSDQGDYAAARALLEEGLAMQRALGNRRGIAVALGRLAHVLLLTQGDPATIRSLLEEGLTVFREVGDKANVASNLNHRGQLALQQGDLVTARSLVEEGLALFRELGDQSNIAWSLSLLAKVQAHQGDYAAAHALYEQSLETARRVGDQRLIATSLKEVGDVVAAAGELAWATRLWGTAEALREAMGTPLPPVERAKYEQEVASARTHLGEQAFTAAWAEGRAMTWGEALAARELATTSPPALAGQPSPPPVMARVTYPDGLTAREVEVLRLVAQGLSDAQVAQQLVISPRTVHAHLSSIYSKLGITSRSAATRYAIEHQFV
jgi:predicted ATPase/DNA-binding CsgD family transcriptional regulator